MGGRAWFSFVQSMERRMRRGGDIHGPHLEKDGLSLSLFLL